jgi:asparagine synthase (glutamine-hydrolysing)
MPGVFGISARAPSGALRPAFERMTSKVRDADRFQHESLLDPSNHSAFGRVHLGILQPFAQLRPDAAIQVLFHGDLYNEDRLGSAAEVAAGAAQNRAAAVVSSLYERYGPKFAACLDGTFCAAILDRNRRRLILASDLVGSYPIYWTTTGDALVFASELRALLRHPEVRRSLNPAAVGDYLTFGFPLGVKTVADGVNLLPAGSTLVFEYDTGSVTIDRYASIIDSLEPWRGSQQEYLETVHDAFTRAVGRALSGPYRFGLSLSGGLDSRAILSAVNGQTASLHTYTLGVRGCADQVIAERLAAISGTSHDFFELTEEYLHGFLPGLREMVRLTDGMYLSHGLTEMLALKFLSKSPISVLLRGHGGELAKTSLAWPLQTDSQICSLTSTQDLVHFLLTRRNYLSAHVSWRDLFTDAWYAQVKDAARASLTESIGSVPLTPAELCSYLYLTEHHRRVTVASLELFRQSVEVRLPFVDAEFLKLLFRAPARWRENTGIHRRLTSTSPLLAKVRNSNTGAPVDADRTLAFVLDKLNSILKRLNVYGYRHYHNFGTWMRQQLVQSVERVLLDSQSLDRGILREATLRRLLDETRRRGADHSHLFQALLILELWQQDNL